MIVNLVKNINWQYLVIASGLALQTAAWAGDGWFLKADRANTQSENTEGRVQIEEAHRAFIEKRYEDMTIQIKHVLMNAESTAEDKDNVLKLLSKSYTENAQSVPVNWVLPQGVVELRVGVRRKNSPDGINYQTNVKIDLIKERNLTEFKLIQYPNTVLVDKKSKLGRWEDVQENATHKVSAFAHNMPTPAEKGLYLVDMTLDNGVRTQGWFILNDDAATESPVVLSPAVGEQIASGTPTIRFQDFRSPEYKPSEKRVLGIDVAQVNGDDWTTKWELYESHPTRTQITVGDTKGEGVRRLAPGKYNLTVIYRERHLFGPVRIQRESSTYVPFVVTE